MTGASWLAQLFNNHAGTLAIYIYLFCPQSTETQ